MKCRSGAHILVKAQSSIKHTEMSQTTQRTIMKLCFIRKNKSIAQNTKMQVLTRKNSIASGSIISPGTITTICTSLWQILRMLPTVGEFALRRAKFPQFFLGSLPKSPILGEISPSIASWSQQTRTATLPRTQLASTGQHSRLFSSRRKSIIYETKSEYGFQSSISASSCRFSFDQVSDALANHP